MWPFLTSWGLLPIQADSELIRLSGHNFGHSAENVISVGSGELLLSTTSYKD